MEHIIADCNKIGLRQLLYEGMLNSSLTSAKDLPLISPPPPPDSALAARVPIVLAYRSYDVQYTKLTRDIHSLPSLSHRDIYHSHI